MKDPDAAYAYGGFVSHQPHKARSQATMTLLRRSAFPDLGTPLERLPGPELWIERLCEQLRWVWCGEVLFTAGGA